MTKDSVIFIIAFARDKQTTVYRDQAKLLLKSIVEFGEWDGPIVVFTNWPDQLLSDELPFDVAQRVGEIPVEFADWSTGKEGKLPSARFRIHAWRHFGHWRHAARVLYLDTDCIVRGPLGPLVDSQRLDDIAGAYVARRNMGRSKWFNGHITPEFQSLADKLPGVQSGTIVFRGGEQFQRTCKEWAALDSGPARDTNENLVTDQSSHNLLHLRSVHGLTDIRSAILPPSWIACPHVGQRNALGHQSVDHAAIWHYWHLHSQADRLVAMASELDRLQRRGNHPAPQGLLGKWRHEKPKEKLTNVWEFHPNGLITVDEPAICGRWEWRKKDSGIGQSEILIDWLWGWEKLLLEYASSDAIPIRLIGESFRNGAFTLTRL